MPSIIRGSDNFDSDIQLDVPASTLIKTYQVTSSITNFDMTDFADQSKFKHYQFQLSNLTSTSDGAQMEIWTSVDGTTYGDTWKHSGFRQVDAATLIAFSESGTNMKVGYSGNQPAETGFNGEFTIRSFHATYGYPSISGTIGAMDRSTNWGTTVFNGGMTLPLNCSAVRIKCNIGNLDGGYISVYGMV